jgi:hypothetical protein
MVRNIARCSRSRCRTEFIFTRNPNSHPATVTSLKKQRTSCSEHELEIVRDGRKEGGKEERKEGGKEGRRKGGKEERKAVSDLNEALCVAFFQPSYRYRRVPKMQLMTGFYILGFLCRKQRKHT